MTDQEIRIPKFVVTAVVDGGSEQFPEPSVAVRSATTLDEAIGLVRESAESFPWRAITVVHVDDFPEMTLDITLDQVPL